jgi:phytoene desaturase
MAPSALLIYIGVNKKVEGLLHHTLFFHNNWENHMHALYEAPEWPEKPLCYVSCPSKTDRNMAPREGDAITILIPIAAGLQDTQTTREEYFQTVLTDIEERLGEKIREYIQVKKIFSVSDFITDFHSYKGNAYGLAHTLNQTALFRPKNRSSKLSNLFYVGQFTNPGIGVPTVSISGKIVAQKIINMYGTSSTK